MRRALVLVACGVALTFGEPGVAEGFAAPMQNDSGATFTKVGTALEAHGIVPCESADWTAKVDEQDGPFYFREERDRRIRLVMAPGRTCPARDAFPTDVDWENANDGVVTITVYKSTKQRTKGVKHYRGNARFIYAYGTGTLIRLDQFEAPELDDPFVATMKELKARRVSATSR